jgi:hypothetical protein
MAAFRIGGTASEAARRVAGAVAPLLRSFVSGLRRFNQSSIEVSYILLSLWI